MNTLANYIKPSASSLNMDDINDNLVTVYSHVKRLDASKRLNQNINELVDQQYYNQIIRSDDTDMVDGIQSSNIAVATSPADRTTVRNADNLGNYPPSYYMTTAEGSSVKNQLIYNSHYYADEIADLRDEVYMLKNELMKNGLLKNTENHMGYTDIFRDEYKPYEYDVIDDEPVAVTSKDMILHTDTAVKIDDKDFVVIRYKDIDKIEVRQIASKLDTYFTFVEPLTGSNLNVTNVEIYKTMGISRDGNFYFAKDKERTPGNTEYYSGLDDDAHFVIKKPVKVMQSGYGYSFRIPERKLGFLTKIELQYLTVKGNPTYRLYVIDQQDINNFKNPADAESMYKYGDKDSSGALKMHFFAKSNPVTLDPTIGQSIVTFSFFNSDLDGGYPVLDRLDEQGYKVKYVMILVAEYADANIHADFMFLQNERSDGTYGDLELNNIVYNYVEQGSTSSSNALTTNDALNNSDLYYAVTLKEAVYKQMIPYKNGLYSAIINSKYPEGISRVRVQMRVYREGGKWSANITNADVFGSAVQSSFDVQCDSYYSANANAINASVMDLKRKMYKPYELRDVNNVLTDTITYPDVVVGNTITTGNTGASGNIVAIDTPAYVRPKDMVYPSPYIISVKGKRYGYVELDSNGNQVYNYKVYDTQKIYLTLKAIIPDGIKYDKDVYSDRLIFEGDFLTEEGSPAFFNQLELQIIWSGEDGIDEESSYTTTQSVGLNSLPLRMGIIHDLTLSSDKVYDIQTQEKILASK